jgi:hypothetical protein
MHTIREFAEAFLSARIDAVRALGGSPAMPMHAGRESFCSRIHPRRSKAGQQSTATPSSPRVLSRRPTQSRPVRIITYSTVRCSAALFCPTPACHSPAFNDTILPPCGQKEGHVLLKLQRVHSFGSLFFLPTKMVSKFAV